MKFTLYADAVPAMEELMEITGLSAEIILSSALSLYQWGLFRTKEGRVICALDEKTEYYTVVEVPGFFPEIAERPKGDDHGYSEEKQDPHQAAEPR